MHIMSNIGKFNERSVNNSLLAENARQNPFFGAQRLSKTIKLLPHEPLLFEVHEIDGEKCVIRQSDVSVLLQAEKYSSIYGQGYFNTIGKGSGSSQAQQVRDKMSDDALFAAIVPRNIQSPAEVKAWSEAVMNDQLFAESQLRDIIAAQQEQEQSASAETSSSSSSSE